MARTTWQDLADADAAPPSRQALVDEALGSTGGRGGALPSSLEDIPQLQDLLAQRRRLEQTLNQLTGAAGAAGPQNERDARRFPVPEAEPANPRLSLRRQDQADERARAEERRAMELETIDERNAQRRDEAQRRDLASRAARRRDAGAQRVTQAAQTWEQHRENLLAARDTARDLARRGRGLGLPGTDGVERAARRVESLTSGLDRIDRAVREVGSLAQGSTGTSTAGRTATDRDSGDGGSGGGGAMGRLREIARDARRFVDEPLRNTDAGRRLRALREELAPPQLRRLTGEDDDGDVNALEQRRQRALQALRERRAADAPQRSGSAARPAEPSTD